MRRFPLVRTAAVVSAALLVGAGTMALASASAPDETEKPATRTVATQTSTTPDAKKRTKRFDRSGTDDPARLAGMLDQLPENLRTDLAKVLTASDADRAGIIENMIADAKSGTYGKDIAKQIEQGERVSTQMREHAKKSWDDMPAELKADLKALRTMDPKDRREARAQITENAQAGKYGNDAQEKWGNVTRFDGTRAHRSPARKR